MVSTTESSSNNNSSSTSSSGGSASASASSNRTSRVPFRGDLNLLARQFKNIAGIPRLWQLQQARQQQQQQQQQAVNNGSRPVSCHAVWSRQGAVLTTLPLDALRKRLKNQDDGQFDLLKSRSIDGKVALLLSCCTLPPPAESSVEQYPLQMNFVDVPSVHRHVYSPSTSTRHPSLSSSLSSSSSSSSGLAEIGVPSSIASSQNGFAFAVGYSSGAVRVMTQSTMINEWGPPESAMPPGAAGLDARARISIDKQIISIQWLNSSRHYTLRAFSQPENNDANDSEIRELTLAERTAHGPGRAYCREMLIGPRNPFGERSFLTINASGMLCLFYEVSDEWRVSTVVVDLRCGYRTSPTAVSKITHASFAFQSDGRILLATAVTDCESTPAPGQGQSQRASRNNGSKAVMYTVDISFAGNEATLTVKKTGAVRLESTSESEDILHIVACPTLPAPSSPSSVNSMAVDVDEDLESSAKPIEPSKCILILGKIDEANDAMDVDNDSPGNKYRAVMLAANGASEALAMDVDNDVDDTINDGSALVLDFEQECGLGDSLPLSAQLSPYDPRMLHVGCQSGHVRTIDTRTLQGIAPFAYISDNHITEPPAATVGNLKGDERYTQCVISPNGVCALWITSHGRFVPHSMVPTTPSKPLTAADIKLLSNDIGERLCLAISNDSTSTVDIITSACSTMYPLASSHIPGCFPSLILRRLFADADRTHELGEFLAMHLSSQMIRQLLGTSATVLRAVPFHNVQRSNIHMVLNMTYVIEIFVQSMSELSSVDWLSMATTDSTSSENDEMHDSHSVDQQMQQLVEGAAVMSTIESIGDATPWLLGMFSSMLRDVLVMLRTRVVSGLRNEGIGHRFTIEPVFFQRSTSNNNYKSSSSGSSYGTDIEEKNSSEATNGHLNAAGSNGSIVDSLTAMCSNMNSGSRSDIYTPQHSRQCTFATGIRPCRGSALFMAPFVEGLRTAVAFLRVIKTQLSHIISSIDSVMTPSNSDSGFSDIRRRLVDSHTRITVALLDFPVSIESLVAFLDELLECLAANSQADKTLQNEHFFLMLAMSAVPPGMLETGLMEKVDDIFHKHIELDSSKSSRHNITGGAAAVDVSEFLASRDLLWLEMDDTVTGDAFLDEALGSLIASNFPGVLAANEQPAGVQDKDGGSGDVDVSIHHQYSLYSSPYSVVNQLRDRGRMSGSGGFSGCLPSSRSFAFIPWSRPDTVEPFSQNQLTNRLQSQPQPPPPSWADRVDVVSKKRGVSTRWARRCVRCWRYSEYKSPLSQQIAAAVEGAGGDFEPNWMAFCKEICYCGGRWMLCKS